MAALGETFDQVSSSIKGLPGWQKGLGLTLMAVIIAGLLFSAFRGSGADYNVLFASLSQEDAAAVVEQLKIDRIPYKLSGGGSAVLVPVDKVYETRLSLAGQGLPRGGGVGFEIFDKTSYSTTDFVQRLNYQRAIQGELSRTIRQFRQVLEARVHIATPRESVFVEDKKPVTASISVKLKNKSGLGKSEIQSIVNLVASAVPGLTADNITLVDTNGHLLFRGGGSDEEMMSSTQLEYQKSIEKDMTRKIESMIEEVVGVGRVRVRVTADIDFKQVDVTQESYDPDGRVMRSEQVSSEFDTKGGADPEGIPGVKGKLATAGAGGTSAAVGGFQKKSSTRNFEISHTTRRTHEAVGSLKRLSVAVMIDGTYKDGKKGGKEYVARSPEELRWFESLVKKAMGYSEDRGDQVEVVSMAFAASTSPEVEVDKIAVWRDWARELFMPMVYLLLGFGVMLLIIRPFFRFLANLPTGGGAASLPAGSRPGDMTGTMVEEEELGLAPKGLTDKERIFRLAQSDPSRAADLVRKWLREEG